MWESSICTLNCLRTDGSIMLVLFVSWYLHVRNRFRDTLSQRFNGHILEQSWTEFTIYLRKRTSTWLWVCTSCEKEYTRRKANGRFRCRTYSTILTDVATRRKQTKQVMISRRVEVPSCTGVTIMVSHPAVLASLQSVLP